MLAENGAQLTKVGGDSVVVTVTGRGRVLLPSLSAGFHFQSFLLVGNSPAYPATREVKVGMNRSKGSDYYVSGMVASVGGVGSRVW